MRVALSRGGLQIILEGSIGPCYLHNVPMANPSDDPLFGRLEHIDEFRRLTPTQQTILLEHQRNPTATKQDIAKTVGCAWNTVHALFYSEKFEKINHELAMQGVRELIQKAIFTLNDCLNSSNDSVRYAAATKILGDAGVLRSPETTKSIKQDNKIMIVWGDQKINPMEAIKNVGPAINSLLPAP